LVSVIGCRELVSYDAFHFTNRPSSKSELPPKIFEKSCRYREKWGEIALKMGREFYDRTRKTETEDGETEAKFGKAIRNAVNPRRRL
jgi:hypothetical protein